MRPVFDIPEVILHTFTGPLGRLLLFSLLVISLLFFFEHVLTPTRHCNPKWSDAPLQRWARFCEICILQLLTNDNFILASQIRELLSKWWGKSMNTMVLDGKFFGFVFGFVFFFVISVWNHQRKPTLTTKSVVFFFKANDTEPQSDCYPVTLALIILFIAQLGRSFPQG